MTIADQRTASRKAAGLDLPDHREGFAVPAVFDALQGQQGAAPAAGDGFLADDPSLAANLDQAACLRNLVLYRRRQRPHCHVVFVAQPVATIIIHDQEAAAAAGAAMRRSASRDKLGWHDGRRERNRRAVLLAAGDVGDLLAGARTQLEDGQLGAIPVRLDDPYAGTPKPW
jgi:hypothetical protein